MRMNFQPALYVNYILKMCKTNVNDLVKSATNLHNAPANFCHYLKELLHDEFVTLFKNQIQQNKENGKLRLFRKVKVNFNFEYYLSQMQNVKHRQASCNETRAVARTLIGGGGVYSYIQVLPD